MKIQYNDGPDKIACGAAGTFLRGVPRDVPEEMAKRLLGKTSITFSAAETRGKKE